MEYPACDCSGKAAGLVLVTKSNVSDVVLFAGHQQLSDFWPMFQFYTLLPPKKTPKNLWLKKVEWHQRLKYSKLGIFYGFFLVTNR